MLLSNLISDIFPSIGLNVDVTGIACDISGNLPDFGVKPGYLFCEISFYPFETVKNDNISIAIKSGCVAILVESEKTSPNIEWRNDSTTNRCVPVVRIQNLQFILSSIASKFYGNPSKKLKTIAVTGTNGKTSTCHLTSQALECLGHKCGVIGTLGHGLRNNYFDNNMTSPHPHICQELLAKMVDIGCDSVAMEASSIGVKMGRLENVDIDVAIFTNLTHDHMDVHESMEEYASAKRRLFYWKSLKHVILNVDCPFGLQLMKELAAKRPELFIYALTLGEKVLDCPPHVQIIKATNYSCSLAGIEVSVDTPWGDGIIHSELIGVVNIFNVLTVLTVCCLMDHKFDHVINILSLLSTIPGRLENIQGPADKATVFVDFGHCPESLAKTMKTLKSLPHEKLWCIFGCGGGRDQTKRLLMAQSVSMYADRIIVTDDNPRFEDPDIIFDHIKQGLDDRIPTVFVHNRRKAIELAIIESKRGDIVLIGGRGGEQTQKINGIEIPFDDSIVANEIFASL